MVSDLRVGAKAPNFDLPGVDGKNLVFESFLAQKAAIVVIFTCNHCPYSMAYEERLLKLQSKFADKGVAFIRINPDDETLHPEDSMEEMKKRAVGKGADFIYLRDKTGDAAKAFGAKVMPEAFLVDSGGVIRYTGRIDDCWQTAKRVRRHDLKEAIEGLLSDNEVAVKETRPVGCAIKRGEKP
jgi:peroxiredoxin